MQQPDWRVEFRYGALMAQPEAMGRLEQAAARGKKRLTAREFMERGQQARDVWELLGGSFDGLEKQVSNLLGSALGRALGFEINKVHTAPYPQPVGMVLVGVSCAMAETGYRLTQVLQGTDGCVLEAALPRNWATKEGSVVCAVAGNAQQAQVQSAVKVTGQLYDWGRGKRVLADLSARTAAWVAAG
ncbi:MAG: hypothetical protein HOU01_04285 [Streptomycetaceae bacterium]|nr:hypothetical protein [Streptomycetaceae bacterium]